MVYEDENVIAFRDIAPQAPCHVLVVPRQHVCDVHEIATEDSDIMADLFGAVKAVVAKECLAERGYRLVINSGDDGGQAVPHLHVHVIGKRKLSGTMG